MRLEVGKSYVTGGGYKATVLSDDDSGTPFYVRHENGFEGCAYGLWHYRSGECNTNNSERGLIAEWVDATPKDPTPYEIAAQYKIVVTVTNGAIAITYDGREQ